MKTQIVGERIRRSRGLLQDLWGNFHQGRTTLRNIGRRQASSGAVGHVKRAAVRIENATRALDDQAVQISGPDCLGEGLAEAVQKIEDERFFDLHFLLRALDLADAPEQPTSCEDPTSKRRNQQSDK